MARRMTVLSSRASVTPSSWRASSISFRSFASSLPSATASFTLSRNASFFLSPSNHPLMLSLIPMSSSAHEGGQELADDLGGLVRPRLEFEKCITDGALQANALAIEEEVRRGRIFDC